MTTAPLAPAVSSRDRAFSGWLDAFRALAAFAVLYSHCRTSFLWSVSPGMVLSIPSRVMYFLSGFGEEAVIVFFVLSGYLVGGTVIRSVRERRWSWRRYLLQRGTRLYVVLIPALFLTLAWDTGESVVSQHLTYEVAWLPVPASWAKLLGIMVAVSAYAYVVSLVTERQTERLRRWLERRVLPAKGAT
jgi:peptidoglycan/LPS O-acetylase OafA/YrhL